MNPEYVIGGGLIWRLLRKKIGFWYVHGAVTLRLRIAKLFTHKIFTASTESCRLKSGKVSVVGHGIDTEIFKPQNIPHPPAVLSIGRISPSKQLEIIIDACRLVQAKIPSLVSIIAGDAGSPEEVVYALQVKEKAKKGGVIVMASMPHAGVPELLQKGDVFLNASTTGSLDKAVLEAMSAGVVPVTSNRAYRPMLSPLGLFVEPNAEKFAAVCIPLFTEPEMRNKLSQTVREEIVKNHSFSRLMDALQVLYASL